MISMDLTLSDGIDSTECLSESFVGLPLFLIKGNGLLDEISADFWTGIVGVLLLCFIPGALMDEKVFLMEMSWLLDEILTGSWTGIVGVLLLFFISGTLTGECVFSVGRFELLIEISAEVWAVIIGVLLLFFTSGTLPGEDVLLVERSGISADFRARIVGVLLLFFVSGTLIGEGALNIVALLLVSLASPEVLTVSIGDRALGMVDSFSCSKSLFKGFRVFLLVIILVTYFGVDNSTLCSTIFSLESVLTSVLQSETTGDGDTLESSLLFESVEV